MSDADPTAPPENDHSGRPLLAWNPLGLVVAIVICASFVGLTANVLIASGDLAVIAHGMAFLATGALVVGFLVYTATLAADDH